MNEDKARPLGGQELRPISTWVRRYAEHRRGLHVVVGLLLNLAIFAAIGGGAYLGGRAYRADHMPLAALGGGLAAMGCVAVLYMALTRSGRELPSRIASRLAGDEGEVNLDAAASRRKQHLTILLGVVFGTCVLAQVWFGDSIPVPYRQPVSALYCTPFLVGVWLLQRPSSGYLALLWPALYALHAALLLLGAPILFTGRWEAMNLLLPLVGYGIVANFVNHLFARFALRKVRQLAAIDEVHPAENTDGRTNP